jgi:hypothetical protein
MSAHEGRPGAETFQRNEELVFDLIASCGKIHQASTREFAEGPKRSNRKHARSLSCEIGARRDRLIAGFVVEKNLSLPIVKSFNAEDRIGK